MQLRLNCCLQHRDSGLKKLDFLGIFWGFLDRLKAGFYQKKCFQYSKICIKAQNLTNFDYLALKKGWLQNLSSNKGVGRGHIELKSALKSGEITKKLCKKIQKGAGPAKVFLVFGDDKGTTSLWNGYPGSKLGARYQNGPGHVCSLKLGGCGV